MRRVFNVRGKPEWTEALVRPVFEDGFDFVSPYYLRHKYGGPILNSIVYPLVRFTEADSPAHRWGFLLRQMIGHYIAREWDANSLEAASTPG
jgi:hypothetical protein